MTNLRAQTQFDSIKRIDDDGNEYWFARELQPLLGYEKWERFKDTIERAKIACENIGQNPESCFPSAGKTSQMPNGGEKELTDYKLRRFSCYLIAIQGDPRKIEVAQAQAYFAVMTIFAEQTITNSIENEVIDENSIEFQMKQLDDLAIFLKKMETVSGELSNHATKNIWEKSVAKVIEKRFGIDIHESTRLPQITQNPSATKELRVEKQWNPVEFFIPFIIRFCREKKKPGEDLILTVADMQRRVYQVRNLNEKNKPLLEEMILECQRLGILRDTGRLTAKGCKVYSFSGDV